MPGEGYSPRLKGMPSNRLHSVGAAGRAGNCLVRWGLWILSKLAYLLFLRAGSNENYSKTSPKKTWDDVQQEQRQESIDGSEHLYFQFLQLEYIRSTRRTLERQSGNRNKILQQNPIPKS